ncbi:MAG: OmpH family outer membrane protein [Flavobacteriaceae bacterium]|nr:OmpH family outer membrane protein [Flavobacteriaceae bacterium]
MKKILLLLTVIFSLASCTQKIAFVDVEQLMKSYDETKAMEADLKAKQDKLKFSLDSLALGFQQRVQDYERKMGSMSPQSRDQIEQKLRQEQQQIQGQQQQASQMLQQISQESFNALSKKVDSFVEIYAKDKGYKMILGTNGKGTVMYGDEKLDVTEQVVEKLNEAYKVKK